MNLIGRVAAIAVVATMVSSSNVAATDEKLSLPPPDAALKLTEAKTDTLGTLPPGIGLPVGTLLPVFVVTTHQQKPVRSSDLLKQGRLLVVFYRGGWCPYCNLQIRQLTEAWPEFQKRGVTPVLISADKVDAAALAQRSYEIPFPVLSDPDLVAHHAFKVVMELDAATYAKYQLYGIEVEQWSGREHHKFAVSSAFLINTNGSIAWAHASPDYTVRPSVKQLLAVIDQHASKP